MQSILKNIVSSIQLLAWISAILLASSNALAAEKIQTIQIGSGSLFGNYFRTAFAICNYINKDIMTTHIACRSLPTAGSTENIDGLRSGRFQLAIAQADAVVAAKNGSIYFADATPYDDLRQVQILYPEIYTVLVRQASSFSVFSDLKNKRVNVGNTGSGNYIATQSIVAALDWSPRDKASFVHYSPSEQMVALCNSQIDAAVMVVGHPSAQFDESAIGCPIRWVGFSSQNIEKIEQEMPYYTTVTIPDGMYNNIETPTEKTLGINAILVADKKTSDTAIFEIVSMINQTLEGLQIMVPALDNATSDTLYPIENPRLPPIHSGALNFYQSTQ